jgi:hypothetical protein
MFFLVISCRNEKIRRASKAGIEIAILSKKNSYFVVINPSDDFDGNLRNENYIQIKISGGFVPYNHLNFYNDPDTKKLWFSYTNKVYQTHLDSSFVFFENTHDMCYDNNQFQSRDCVDFDLFYVLYDQYR